MMNNQNLLPIDGETYLYHALFDKETSTNLFNSLISSIVWKHEHIVIMGQQIMQPRLTAWYGDEGKLYSYTGLTMHPNPWTADLLIIKEIVEKASNETFNSALLNLYRDGRDSVGWHRDNERSLGNDPVIASVSFGEPRIFSLKHVSDKKLKQNILLTNGSFLIMKGGTQQNWLHRINKDKSIVLPRINITFRNIKAILPKHGADLLPPRTKKSSRVDYKYTDNHTSETMEGG